VRTRYPLILLLAAFAGWSTAFNLTQQWLPVVAWHRGAGTDQTGLLLAAGYAGAACLGLLCLSADRFGLRRVLLLIWGIGAAAALALAVAPSWGFMLVPAVLFLASSGAVPVLGALTALYTPAGEENRGFAWLFAGGPVGLLAAVTLGGWAAQHLSPAAPVWLAAATQVLATVAILFLPDVNHTVEERKPDPSRSSPLFLLAAVAGYGLLCLPNNFTVLYAGQHLGVRLDYDGLLHALPAGAQLLWLLLLTRLPPGPDLPVAPGMRMPRGTVLALAVILGATGAGSLLPALLPGVWTLALGLTLRASLFSVQAVAAGLLSQGQRRGRTAPMTGAAFAAGLATAAASAAGGLLYRHGPDLPFLGAGIAGLGGALLGSLLLAVRPEPRRSQ
jgi:MFS family permease